MKGFEGLSVSLVNSDCGVRSLCTDSLGLRRPGPSWVGKGPERMIHSYTMYSTILSRTGFAGRTMSVERLLICYVRT